MNQDNRTDEQLDQLLDRTTAQIRDERVDAEFETSAVGRVWQQLQQRAATAAPAAESPHRIDSCAGFQALLPAYRSGKLVADRLLLLQDHLGECVPCRGALKRLKKDIRPASVSSAQRTSSAAARFGWRLAAAAVLFLALIGFSFKTDVFSIESGGLIRIEAVDGDLFRVTDTRAIPLRAGEMVTLERGESLRTAKGSSAILAMADMSQIEMRERSQISVRERNHLLPGRKSDGLVELVRGSVMIEASNQGSGHLYVDTADCSVAVTGTVFAVSRGITGSRVSVVEGRVEVRQHGDIEILAPGDQVNTSATLNPVRVEEDIAWSRNSDQYIALLAEMRALGRELDRALIPGLRYSSDLLDLAPADTAIFVAMPNISDELSKAHDILMERISTSEVLRQWWDRQVGPDGEKQLQKIIERIRTFGDHLGDEILMTVQFGETSKEAGPLFLARVSDSQSFLETVSAQIAELEANSGEDLELNILDVLPPPDTPILPSNGIYLWAHDGVVALAPQIQQLWKLDSAMQGYDNTTLVGTAFHDRLSALYDDGVEWAVGIDVERLIHMDQDEKDENANEQLARIGLDTVQYIIAERKQRDGRTEQRAELTFAEPRQRMAAWLAEPAPLGALDFVGPDANIVAGFVMKDMGIIVEELFEILGASDADFERSLAEFEREEGIDIRRDFADPLGGEMLIAIDGPVLPVPSWKVVAEVYDPARLQHAIQWLVERINLKLTDDGKAPSLEFETEEMRGRTYHRVGSTKLGVSIHYIFDSGYLLAGPSRGLLDKTLQNRDAGIMLANSATFIDLLPPSGEINFSGLLYQNLAPILGPLAGTLEALGGDDGMNSNFLTNMASETEPGLALFYGRDDSIAMSAITEGGIFGSALNQLSGASGLLDMQQSLAKSLGQLGH